MGDVYKNKLTSCFDDILKISAEMMQLQQLKNVQLDPYMVNGFSTQQQHSLKDKIHTFHGLLDDLENALNKSNDYVESLAAMGKESRRAEVERLRRLEEEEEERKKRLEQEAEARRKEEEEAKAKAQAQAQAQAQAAEAKKEEEAKMKAAKLKTEAESRAVKVAAEEEQKRKKLQQDETQQQSMFDGLDFSTDLTGEEINSGGNGDSGNMKSPMGMVQASIGDDGDKKGNPSRAPGGDAQKGLYGELNTMDLSMFSDLDAGTFDPAGFEPNDQRNNNTNINTSNENNTGGNNISNVDDNETANDSKNTNNQINENGNPAFNTQVNTESGLARDQLDFDQSNPSAMLGNDINMGDNGEDYLTLNDFNDLNIDWSTTGEGGDLDLNGFNI